MRSWNSRGAALAETAIILSFTLMMLLGTMQLALLSYYQVQLDGATFFYAQQYAAGANNKAVLAGTLQRLFPSIVTASIVETAKTPPDTTQPVNYTQWGNQTLRYGGAALIRPERLSTQLKMSTGPLSIFGGNIALSAGNVDGRSMVGNHDDDAQGVGYNSGAAYGALTDPLTGDDQNTPPYYFDLADMRYCGAWTTMTSPGPCLGTGLQTLGLSEYLKDDNYKNTVNGVAPGGTFQYIACHQRVFAAIGNFLLANPVRPASTKPSDFAGNNDWNETPSGPMIANSPLLQPYSFRLLYTWDLPTTANIVGKGFLGEFHPLHPEIGC